MSSNASLSSMQRLVEQLKLEAGVERIKRLSGSRRTSAVLYAERLQRCPAHRSSCWEQSFPGAEILCFTLKSGLNSDGGTSVESFLQA
ncbi:unnamed protein product [Lepidochelys olivacea]